MTNLVARSSILKLEDAMRSRPDQIELPVKHYFAPGVYARELVIPAGVTAVGKIHKTEHLSIISKGRVLVVSEAGREVIEGPHTFVSKPGAKRAVYAFEETTWTTIHITEETDLVKLEQEIIAPSFEALEAALVPKVEDNT